MKPLRAFPFPVNIGTDICQVSRIYGILRSPRGQRFIQRVLAPEEQERVKVGTVGADLSVYGSAQISDEVKDFSERSLGHEEIARRDPDLWKKATFVAGRFAAKEAAIKAHSHRRLTFHDVIIERRGRDEERLGSGPPVARIRAAEGEEEDASAMVSISHDGDYATAVCLAHDPSVVEKKTDGDSS